MCCNFFSYHLIKGEREEKRGMLEYISLIRKEKRFRGGSRKTQVLMTITIEDTNKKMKGSGTERHGIGIISAGNSRDSGECYGLFAG